ncbi:head-tail connector protein [Roseinatronobacter bogoriensis]|uniref:Phage gp6-like head-tail connector protein n=2 Tax=Roseinatronobacter bogoriensis TaxID=119542 RepID=A0A2K8KE57_9RHOB|nr:hypothetical protein [Rhodobaca]ATX67714.1 hypothetical protein BG454_06275 [Rhodobaca barguzinensis]TDW37499.1 putative phiE125 gp8 family phage protein [Rhodobaca barguzinensis]TDY68110.1 putative phiE125 gp8 family phage protein [Rhodobaca bogoriensis DSM 18756]
MTLTEMTPIPLAALPLAELRDHLRLSSGFADDATQDGLLEQYLRTAIATVEGRVARVLFLRSYSLRLSRWRDGYAQALPVAPVTALHSVTMLDAGGAPTLVDPARYRLDADGVRPRLESAGTALPAIPTGGAVVIEFAAGFGAEWSDIPADLRQAVLLLAAQYYESRDMGGSADMSFGIRALLERWRDLRLGGRV